MKSKLNSRTARLLGGLAVTAALFVPLTVFGGSALARSTAAASEYQYSGSSQYRVQVCHLTGSKKHPFHTITVSPKAVAAHVRHCDHAGPCTGAETVKPKHHHSNGNGNGNGHHHSSGNGNSNGATNGSSAAPTTPGSNGQGHGKGHGK
jgi:hypothetical protein